MSLQKELDFLERLSIRAAGGSKSPPITSCPHSEEMARLAIEKEHIFFKREITEEQRDQLMQSIDESMLKIQCDC
jgi:hypothetical protein